MAKKSAAADAGKFRMTIEATQGGSVTVDKTGKVLSETRPKPDDEQPETDEVKHDEAG